LMLVLVFLFGGAANKVKIHYMRNSSFPAITLYYLKPLVSMNLF